jgi:MFS transporter, DHA2 family, multidrug resistance protein
MASMQIQLTPDRLLPERIHKRRWLTLAVLCLSLLIVVMDNTIVNVTLPTLVRQLRTSNSALQWIVDAYTLVFAGLLLTSGSLGDRIGRKRVLTAGLIVFGTGSALAAWSGSASQLVAMRALMGLGASMIMPATLSILTNVFLDPAERAKAIALWAGVSGLGVALGPVSGGYLLRHFWWGSIFLVNVPVVIAALVGGRVLVPASRDPRPRRLDALGALLSISAISSLVWAIIEGPTRGWTSSTILIRLAVALILLLGFVVWELHTPEPMLQLRFFANPRLTAAGLAISMAFFGLIGSYFLLTQYLQFVHHYDPLQAGLRTLPFAGAMLLTAPLSARLAERIGTKRVVAAGLTVMAAGALIGATLQVNTSDAPLLLSMLMLGVGMGLGMAPATESVMGSLPKEYAGVGSAINDTLRELGIALGVAVIGSLATSLYKSHLDRALRHSRLVLSGSTIHAARSSLGAALGVAAQATPTTGSSLAHAASQAFTDGFHAGFLLTAGMMLASAAVALIFLPARAARSVTGIGTPADATHKSDRLAD